jgi:hypothetical protein
VVVCTALCNGTFTATAELPLSSNTARAAWGGRWFGRGHCPRRPIKDWQHEPPFKRLVVVAPVQVIAQVVDVRWRSLHGYNALVLGAGHRQQRNLHPAQTGYFLSQARGKREVARRQCCCGAGMGRAKGGAQSPSCQSHCRVSDLPEHVVWDADVVVRVCCGSWVLSLTMCYAECSFGGRMGL